jgi:hypothetical protein
MNLRAGLWIALVGMGCGGEAARPRSPEEVPIAAGAARDGGVVEAGDSLTSLAELVARAPQVAPGMRVLAQGEEASPKAIDLPRADVDLCVRAVFVAESPVKAALASSAGDTLETTRPTVSGTLGPRGPVCIRRGQVLTLRFEQTAARVRYVMWGAP